MRDGPETVELVVEVADPLELLVDLCRPTGAFLPCVDAAWIDAKVILRVRLPDREAPIRVSCLVVDRAPGEHAGVYVRFPNANAHALDLLRAMAPVLADRAPSAPKSQVVLHAADASAVRTLYALVDGRAAVLPVDDAVVPGDRISLCVGDAWGHGVLLAPLLATHVVKKEGKTLARAVAVDEVGKTVVNRFLERLARALHTPRVVPALVM